MNKSMLRSFQTYLPFLQNFRYDVQFALRDALNKAHENDFNALKDVDFGDALFIDIGSNRGEAIQSMLLTYPKSCRVIGFEPNPLVFNLLEKRYKNYPEVEVHNCGLGNDNSVHDLYIPFYRKWMFDGLASFNEEDATSWLRYEGRFWNYDESLLSVKKERCVIARLDDFNLKPDFIKIDVQGFELEVLKGAADTIADHSPMLLIESLNEDIANFLEYFGYGCYHYDGELKKGKGKLNTFCVAEKVLA